MDVSKGIRKDYPGETTSHKMSAKNSRQQPMTCQKISHKITEVATTWRFSFSHQHSHFTSITCFGQNNVWAEVAWAEESLDRPPKASCTSSCCFENLNLTRHRWTTRVAWWKRTNHVQARAESARRSSRVKPTCGWGWLYGRPELFRPEPLTLGTAQTANSQTFGPKCLTVELLLFTVTSRS